MECHTISNALGDVPNKRDLLLLALKLNNSKNLFLVERSSNFAKAVLVRKAEQMAEKEMQA